MKKVSCHCKKVKLQINVNDLGKLQRCNCSICRKKGSIMAAVDLNTVRKTIERYEIIKRSKLN